ncbi:PAS domain S-box protein [Aquamicrobium defluvii]|uniref:PAS domain S-box protein n=1 Tax=Aquamicrobium defluvii TaxID=69279 RepID=UPI001FDFF92D|nr:PAS domain S-box protein [Aquamicrobium defluvii]
MADAQIPAEHFAPSLAVEDVLQALPEAVYMTDPGGRITLFNQAAATLWGRTPEIGQDEFCGSWKLFWPDGRPLPHAECPMARALKERQPNRGQEIIAERPDGSRVTVLAFPTPLFDANRELSGAINMLVDVTHRSIAYEEAQRFAAIVNSSDDAILAKDLEGTIVSWNRGAERLFGYTADEIIGKSVVTLIPADRPDEEPNILSHIRAGETIDHYETVRRRKDGSLVEISLSVSPIRDRQGRIAGAATIARDITERRRAEQQQHLLIQEMNHRIKNLFTLAGSVVSLSKQSAKTADDLASAVSGRLNALALAHMLTVPATSEASERVAQETTLHALVRTITAPYDHDAETGRSRIRIAGSDVGLSGAAVTSFALLLHEFATNAAKYGALSAPAGAVDVKCDETGEMLVLTWTETGGPLVERSFDGDGFGSVLGRATVRGQLGGEISREWKPEGLIIRLSVARDRMTADLPTN